MSDLTKIVPNATIFRIGSTGSAVKRIQQALAQLGYPLHGTGYFGTATDTAVQAFQKRSGLTVDGKVGNGTAAALDRALASNLAGVPAEVVKEIQRPLWFEAGLQLLNTKEEPGKQDNEQIIDWAHDEGGDIAKEYTHDSIPWCGLFANHCLTKAGLKGTETLWALDFAGKWPSVRLAGVAVGAFAPMLRNGGGHIIMIAGKDQHGNIMGLGGNQGDKVSIVPFPVSRLNKGFWWPAGEPLPKTGFSSLPVVTSSGRVSSNEA
jgi:uncharacterized protein (TIGR02594 family)